MELDLREGSHIQTAEGDDLGAVRQFVVKPSTAEFTHLLVEKGVFFTDDRVVPVEAVDHVEDDVIILRDEVDPGTLPGFVREHYTSIDEETGSRLGVPGGDMWRFPTSHIGPFPLYPAYPIAAGDPAPPAEPRVRSQLAESEIVGANTPVMSTNGEKVGTVSEVRVDNEGHLSHLVVDLGFLSDEKVLPAHWVESIESDGIRLAVSNTAVESLETIT